MTVHLILPDAHCHPDYNNNRADLFSKLIIDLRPDVVINLGDLWDMPSLSSYDKGKKSFQGRNYRKDIEAGIEFNDRVWSPVKRRKRKLPYRVFLEGNHEERVTRAIELAPELEGAISFNDFQLNNYYDTVVRYQGNTPGTIEIDKISYAHYHISGVAQRAVSGEHQAYTLLSKQFQSCTQGHTHTVDYCVRTNATGEKIMGLVAGVYQDYSSGWSGECNKLWWRGCVIKRNVHQGSYDPQFVSLEWLKKEYG